MQNLDTQTSGIISAIPFVINVPMNILTGMAADFFIAKGIRVIAVRKAFTAIGMTTCAISIIGLNYSGCNLIAAAAMATMLATMDTLTVPGFKSCTFDIAPNLSGIIFSLSATVCQTTGFFAPQVAGALREAFGFFGWQIAFWIAASLYIVGMMQFMIFGSNKKQSWAQDKRKTSPISVVTVEEVIEGSQYADKVRPPSIVTVEEIGKEKDEQTR